MLASLQKTFAEYSSNVMDSSEGSSRLSSTIQLLQAKLQSLEKVQSRNQSQQLLDPLSSVPLMEHLIHAMRDMENLLLSLSAKQNNRKTPDVEDDLKVKEDLFGSTEENERSEIESLRSQLQDEKATSRTAHDEFVELTTKLEDFLVAQKTIDEIKLDYDLQTQKLDHALLEQRSELEVAHKSITDLKSVIETQENIIKHFKSRQDESMNTKPINGERERDSTLVEKNTLRAELQATDKQLSELYKEQEQEPDINCSSRISAKDLVAESNATADQLQKTGEQQRLHSRNHLASHQMLTNTVPTDEGTKLAKSHMQHVHREFARVSEHNKRLLQELQRCRRLEAQLNQRLQVFLIVSVFFCNQY